MRLFRSVTLLALSACCAACGLFAAQKPAASQTIESPAPPAPKVEEPAKPKLLAVLPLDVTHAKGKLDEDAQAALEEAIRDVMANALRSSGWTVLSGQTMLQILRDNGIDPTHCSEGACQLTTARELKVDAFVSGALQYVDNGFTGSVRLIDSPTGAILSSQTISGQKVAQMRDAFDSGSNAFLSRAGLIKGAAPAPPVSAAATIKVLSLPPGALVTIDGMKAGTTPLEHSVDAGNHSVSLQLGRSPPVLRRITLPAGETKEVSESFGPVPKPTPPPVPVPVVSESFRAAGLEWIRNPVRGIQQANAKPNCESVRVAGRGGWRIPTREELVALYKATRLPSALNQSIPGINEDGYLSASKHPKLPHLPWVVRFSDGGTASATESEGYSVRCCRLPARKTD